MNKAVEHIKKNYYIYLIAILLFLFGMFYPRDYGEIIVAVCPIGCSVKLQLGEGEYIVENVIVVSINNKGYWVTLYNGSRYFYSRKFYTINIINQ